MAIANGENHLLALPVGADKAIQRVQKLLYNQLDWQNTQVFGRVSKVPNPETKPGMKPFLYYSLDEYKSVMRDDNYNCQIFFVLADKQTTAEGQLFKADCKIVFMLDLKKIYPSDQERADARAQEDVVKILKSQQTFVMTSIGTGIKESLGEFDTEDIKFTDMHPNHCFCITGQLSFMISC